MPLRIYVRRHAERPTSGKGHALATTPLTPAGEKAARQAGRGLKQKPRTHFYSTPVGRSKMTAERMAEGAKLKRKIHLREDLGRFVKPGANTEALGKLLDPPAHVVIGQWLRGETPPSLLYTPHELAAFAVYAMRNAPRGAAKLGRNKLNIQAIAHDVTLVALYRELTGLDPPLKNKTSYADFLEAAQLKFFPSGSVFFFYRNRQFNVTSRFRKLLEEGKKLKSKSKK